MAIGVRKLERVVFDVGVAVEGLGGVAAGDDGIGLGKAAQFGVIIARLIEIQAGFFIDMLSGIAVGYIERGGIVLVAFMAEGGLAVVLNELGIAQRGIEL